MHLVILYGDIAVEHCGCCLAMAQPKTELLTVQLTIFLTSDLSDYLFCHHNPLCIGHDDYHTAAWEEGEGEGEEGRGEEEEEKEGGE